MTIEACVSKAVFKPWLPDLIELFLVWGAIRCIYKARYQSRLVGVTNIQLLVAQMRSSTKWSANLLHSKRKDLIGWQRKFGAVKFWSVSHACERQRAFSLCRSQASDLVDLVACLNWNDKCLIVTISNLCQYVSIYREFHITLFERVTNVFLVDSNTKTRSIMPRNV